ncbi:CcdB-like protein [Sphingomonas sp. Leaf33]|uniref:CcdB family protein n=1 Tax=Sphingomonas sp. Leaf33 TaxID=1736215 RepID=UPI0006F912F3|nr:CcdB family protein [Sphingomonas sp. Leaf33]KQN24875.1 CcdB-like protein [Sphingomonas sp. Leaf33]
MARFDVYELADGAMVVDCQADFLDDIGTRFCIPLTPRGEGPPPNARINPEFEIAGERVVLTTQLAAAIRTGELKRRVGSLDRDHLRVTGAVDVLIGTA